MSVVATNLITRVGDLLDVTVVATSVPGTTQVEEWIYDGALNMCRLLPVEMLGTMISSFTASSDTGWDLNDLDIVKVSSLERDGIQATEIPYSKLMADDIKMPAMHRASTPVFALHGGSTDGELTAHFRPIGSLSTTLWFVERPAPVADWLGSPSTPHLIPPDNWADLIVKYGVIMGRTQDEEPEQAKLEFEMWKEWVQMFVQGKTLGADG